MLLVRSSADLAILQCCVEWSHHRRTTLSGIGFNVNYSGTNHNPTVFYVNGTLCQESQTDGYSRLDSSFRDGAASLTKWHSRESTKPFPLATNLCILKSVSSFTSSQTGAARSALCRPDGWATVSLVVSP